MFGIKSKFFLTAGFAGHAEFNQPYVRRVNFDFFSVSSAANSPFAFNVL
jgi:hypothetical protein